MVVVISIMFHTIYGNSQVHYLLLYSKMTQPQTFLKGDAYPLQYVGCFSSITDFEDREVPDSFTTEL